MVSRSVFFYQSQADSRGHEEKVGVGDARADMAEAFDQFFMRKDPAGADDVFFKLLRVSMRAPLKSGYFSVILCCSIYGKGEPPMKIKVESHSDSKGQESPTRFTLGTRTIEVEACVDRWHGELACYYRVLGSDENSYILKDPSKTARGSWFLLRIKIPAAPNWNTKAKGNFSKHSPLFLLARFYLSSLLSTAREIAVLV